MEVWNPMGSARLAQHRTEDSILHPHANLAAVHDTGALLIERAKGVYVYDAAGKDYIDGMAGLWCTALGYGNEELVEAAAAQMRKLSFAHLFTGRSHDPAIELAEKLKEIAPVPVSKVFFCSSGSEANDTQMKLVWYMNNALGRPRKKKIVSRQRAYHGVTIAAASLTGLPTNHAGFDVPIAGVIHTDCPHYYRNAFEGESEEEFATRLVAHLEELILREDPETVAAFIAEPVMGVGGVIVPPATYFEKIAKVCEKYDLLMIADEVITGFGRLGRMFGSEVVGYRPHTLSIAKALSSAYVPIAGVLVPQRMYDALVEASRKIGAFGHGFTYTGHPVAAAVALKTLEIFARDRIVDKVVALMPRFRDGLNRLGQHPLVGEARGLGLMGGIELVADKQTKRAFEKQSRAPQICLRHAQQAGLLLRVIAENTIAICPPLIASASEIDELFARLSRSFDLTLDTVIAAGPARQQRAASRPAFKMPKPSIHRERTCSPVLVEIRQGLTVESVHRGRAVVISDTGEIIRSWGAVDSRFLPRSTAKLLEAIPFISSGAADRWNCSTEELVLACSSHSGEAYHLDVIMRWLSRMGLSERDLKCGADWPFNRKVRAALLQAGARPTAIHNNNSGRHTSFLASALHYGAPIEDYLNPKHPVQCAACNSLKRFCKIDLADVAPCIERSGAPTYPLTLMQLAHGMARYGSEDDLDEPDRHAARRFKSAIRAHSEYLVGPGRTSTQICQATAGKVIVKGGAEAVYAGFVESLKLGFALKIDDGAQRAADVAIIGVLQGIGLLSDAEASTLGGRIRPAIRDASGRKIGEVVWVG
jgi:4-aminobutyrate--pyruvate transaminase